MMCRHFSAKSVTFFSSFLVAHIAASPPLLCSFNPKLLSVLKIQSYYDRIDMIIIIIRYNNERE